jgi:DNA primase
LEDVKIWYSFLSDEERSRINVKLGIDSYRTLKWACQVGIIDLEYVEYKVYSQEKSESVLDWFFEA